MGRWEIHTSFTADDGPLDEAELTAGVDTIMDFLLDHGIDDPAVSGTLSSGTFDIEVSVEAASPMEAFNTVYPVIVDALAAWGGLVIDEDVTGPVDPARFEVAATGEWVIRPDRQLAATG